MAHFEVDPDSLTAAGKVADRQVGHLTATRHYVEDVCGRTGAFSGVLQIFLGSYQETLGHALSGLRDSDRVADRVREAFDGCAREYVASDRAAYKTFERVFGDEVALPPYQAPGSGSTTPGGPSATPEDPRDEAAEQEPFALTKLPEPVGKPLERVVPGPEGKLPAWLDPKAAAKDHALLYLRSRADYDHYLALRHQGMTPDQALSVVRPQAGTVADTYVHDLLEHRRQQAYEDAYTRALADGHDPARAEQLASDAAADQHHQDAVDHGHRRDALETAGVYHEAYNQVGDVVENTTKLVEDGQQLTETAHDLEDYDRFEDSTQDDSAQDWARR